ncbi:MAG: hypothetical protein V4726_03235 [Verrucomicrobiota bacterium]
MKSLPRSLVFPIFVSALLTGAAPLRAGSVERAPVSAEELASVLGMDMKKFTAKFAEPVYATLTLSWRQPGDELVNQLKHSTVEPVQDLSILFTRKDYGKMQMLTGGSNAKKLKDLLEMDVKFGGTGFFYRETNPFAKIVGKQPIQSWVKEQSFEELPLEEPIPLVIDAAAESKDKLMTVIQTQYADAPAFVHLSVTFSKEKPAAPKRNLESAKPGKPAAAAAAPAPAPASEGKPAAPKAETKPADPKK